MIDRNELIAALDGRIIGGYLHNGGYIHVPLEEAEQIYYMLTKQPEVVRCKDCIHSEKCIKPYVDCWCNLYDSYKSPNWFCAGGERR